MLSRTTDATVLVSGSFDNLRSRHVRLLQEAARFGPVHVLLWSDDVVADLTGGLPRFDQDERVYLLQALRYVSALTLVRRLPSPDHLPGLAGLVPASAAGTAWAIPEDEMSAAKREFCERAGIKFEIVTEQTLSGFPTLAADIWNMPSSHRKVIVTGCYDWLHSGHVRFFEEVSALGDLYVAVGNDANVRELKGEGHPLQSQDERRYMVQSIRYVTQAVITKGMGWMDAAPNIDEIRPDIYAVNEDGDVPEKAAFCTEHGLEYVVLKREPKAGLQRRSSTELRGF
ncbi:MAG: adenylyltransferase/cytidyltransferase family protein [Anaerolineae bacterium]|nr:adenylyltransferase/cytidyltransferase family protein [Anaerolineae bacterium]